MISRTGSSAGAERVAGSCAARRGFTLIELMVVILVVGILSSILLPVLMKTREGAKKKWAMKELAELGVVISLYHRDHSGYPPDTGNWGTEGGNDEDDPGNIDPWSIHRYLGSRIVDSLGEEYASYMSMDKRLTDFDPDDDKIGKFTDPFGQPYQLDAMHIIPPVLDDPGGEYVQCGWPYRLAVKNNPSDQEKLKMILDFKFVSYGPDTQSGGDFAFDPQDPPSGTLQDDSRARE